MLVSSNRLKSTQLRLFAQPHPRPEWRELSPEIQQKVVGLLTLLLRQQQAQAGVVPASQEKGDE
jgi:hypothetical protein